MRAPAWWPAPRPGPPWWHGQDEDVGSGGGPGARSAAGGHAGVGEPSAPAGHRLPWPSTVLLTALVLVGTHAAAQGQRGGARAALDPFALVLLLLACAALLWRRRHPVAVVFTTAAVVMVYLGAGYPYGPVFLTVALACFGAVVSGHRRAAWAAAAMLWAGHVVLAHWLYRLLPPSGDSAAPGDRRPWWPPGWRRSWRSANSRAYGGSSGPANGRNGPRPPGAEPTRSGCGWPGNSTTSSRTASP